MFGKALATVSEAVVPIVIVRLLGKTEVGVLTAVLVFYSTASLLLSTGFPSALFYFLPTRSPAERGCVARKLALLLTLLGALLGVAMLALGTLAESANLGLAGGIFDVSTLGLITALALYPLGDVPSRMLPNLLVLEERTRAAAAFGIVKATGMAAATLLPILLGASLQWVLLCVGFFGLVQGLLLLLALRWLYPGRWSCRSTVSVRELIKFSIPLGLTDVVSRLNNQLDRYLIGLSFPAARFAEYHAAAFQVPVVGDISYSVGRVYAADFAVLFKQGKARKAMALWRASIHKTSLLVLPTTCVFLIAAEEVIELLFTADYLSAANVFRLYCCLLLGRVATFGSVIIAAGRPRLVVQAALVTILSNVAISVPCLYFFGFVGPALGTALAFIPSAVYYCYCIAMASGLRLRETFPLLGYLKVLATAALAVIPAVLFKVSVQAPAGLKLAGIAVLVLLSFGVLGTLFRQITSEDWRFARRYLRGRFNSA